MLNEGQVKERVRRWQRAKSDRGNFETHWQQIGELVWPESARFNILWFPGEKRMQKVFDSIGIHSNQLLAAGLFSMLTSPASQWFKIATADWRLMQEREVALFLDLISKIMYHEIHAPPAGFSAATHEGYLSYGCYGNLTTFVDEADNLDFLRFTALPLHECFYFEGPENRVDTLYRLYNRTVLQLVEKFGLNNLSVTTQKLFQDAKYDDVVSCFHVIQPRRDRDGSLLNNVNLPYESVYIEEQETHVIHEGGYHEKPFQAARARKASHEVFGRGSGDAALPDLRMLMRLMQVVIRSAQKATDPPLILPDAGFLNPIRTLPGGLNFYRKGRVNAKNDIGIMPSGNPGIGMEFVDALHIRIREAFYADQLQLNEGPQMTATEVIQRTEEKLRLMGPLFGRLTTEFLGPLINRVHGLLSRAGAFPPPPAILRDQPLNIIYTSPIARAQEQVEANGLMRALEVARPILEMKPNAMDVINEDETLRGVYEMFSVNQEFLHTDAQVNETRVARAQAEAAREDAENLNKRGQGLDSMARAQATAQEAGFTLH